MRNSFTWITDKLLDIRLKHPVSWSITMIYVLTIPCCSSMAGRYGSFWRILKFLFTRCSGNAGSKNWSIFSWAISGTWARFSVTAGARGISSLIVIFIRYIKNLGEVTSLTIVRQLFQIYTQYASRTIFEFTYYITNCSVKFMHDVLTHDAYYAKIIYYSLERNIFPTLT